MITSTDWSIGTEDSSADAEKLTDQLAVRPLAVKEKLYYPKLCYFYAIENSGQINIF